MTIVHPRLQALVREISRTQPMQAKSIGIAVEALAPDEAQELEAYLHFAAGEGWGIERLAEAYATITGDTLREQVYFQRHGRYRHDSFASVAEAVYFDADYMSRYMMGWP